MKRKKKLLLQKIVSFLISIVLLTFLMFIVGEYQREIIFEDQGLEAAIRKKLDKNKGTISNGDVLHITQLNASSNNIQSLKGIENLHRLVELDLDNNFIKDVTSLSQLKKLKVLKLGNNKITSLKSINFQLLSTAKLRELSLSHNDLQSGNDQTGSRFSDISILSNFTNLEILELRDNHLSDISLLAGLVNLKQLDLRENRISDISPLKKLLNLEELNLRENLIKDISPLANFKNLKYLNIHSNNLIEVFYPLERLLNLETLIMQNVPIMKNLSVIRNMLKLNRLNIRNCGIEDISSLVELMSKGAVQDKEVEKATVDIRDNNLIINDPEVYFAIQQMWNNITFRYPILFPTPYNIRQPVFSHKPGFYRKAFILGLSHPDPDAIIYYTLDGSKPNPNNVLTDNENALLSVEDRSRTLLYTDPIDISKDIDWNNEISMIRNNSVIDEWFKPKENTKKAVVIRAIAKSNKIFSKENFATYFIDPKGNKSYTLPVVSIATDRSNLFNYVYGIYVPGINYVNGNKKTGNYFQHGDIWKKPAYFELFDKNGILSLAQNVNIYIHGGVSRYHSLKALRINAKSYYSESNEFNYQFFDTKAIDKFNNIVLRNSGNDSTRSLFRDAAIQTLIQHFPLDTQHYQPSIVFINGEYWGIHNFRDNLDENYIKNHYNIPENDVVILQKNARSNGTQLANKYKEKYKDMLNKIVQGKLNTWEKIDEYMTVSEYIDYHIIEWYAVNTDWPNNNIRYWRYTGNNITDTRGPFDGRWRWMVYDIDSAFTKKDFNMVEFILRVNDDYLWARDLIRSILSINDIRHEFIQRVAIHLNTTFRPKHVKDHISKMASVIEPEIPQHSARWGHPTIEAWYNEVNLMKDFAEQRPSYFRKHMDEHFDEITGTANLIISNIHSKADIKLHTILLKDTTPGVLIENKTWNGLMFTGEAPVKLYSSNVNLSLALIEGSYHIIEQTKNSLVFNMYGDVHIKIKD